MLIGSSSSYNYTTLTSAQRLKMPDSGTSDEGSYDFTSMTRSQMRAAMGELISSGKMSFDESSSLVPMVGASQLIIVPGSAGPEYESSSVNFMSQLQDAIEGAKSRHDVKGEKGYADALAALKRYQQIENM